MREESNQTKSPKASVNSSSFLNDETYGSDATALARRKNCPKVSLSPSSSFSSTPSSLSSMPSTSCDANNASLNSASNSHSSRCSSSSSSSGSSSNREGCSKNDISTINELSTGAQPLSVQQTLSEMLPMSTTTTTTTTTTTGAAAAATTTAAETAEAETAAAVTTKATLKRDKQPQRQQQQRSSWRPLANVSCLAHCDPDLLNNRTFMQSLIARDGAALRYASPLLRSDRDLVLEALRTSGTVLGAVPDTASCHLRADKEVVEAAVRRSPNSFQFAALSLRADVTFVQHLVSVVGSSAAPLVLECAYDEVRRKIEAATPSPSKPIGTSGATAETSPAESPPERSSMSGAAPSN